MIGSRLVQADGYQPVKSSAAPYRQPLTGRLLQNDQIVHDGQVPGYGLTDQQRTVYASKMPCIVPDILANELRRLAYEQSVKGLHEGI